MHRRYHYLSQLLRHTLRARLSANFVEITLALQKLLALHQAGLSLVAALSASADQLAPRSARMWRRMARQISAGLALAQVMASWQAQLGAATVYLLVWGAEVGRLPDCLHYAIRLRQRQMALQQRWQKLLLYPKVVAYAALAMSALVLLWLLPIFTPLLMQSGLALPNVTRFLITISQFLLTQFASFGRMDAGWWLAGLLGLVTLWSIRRRTHAVGHRLVAGFIRRLPFIGPIYVLTYCAHWIHGLDTLLRAGVTLYQALQVLAPSIPQATAQRLSETLMADLAQGRSWAEAIAAQDLLPRWVSALLLTCQDSAALQVVLPQIDTVLEQEIDYRKARYTRYVEPFLLVCLGLFIVVLLGAIYIPLFSIGQSL